MCATVHVKLLLKSVNSRVHKKSSIIIVNVNMSGLSEAGKKFTA